MDRVLEALFDTLKEDKKEEAIFARSSFAVSNLESKKFTEYAYLGP